MVEVLRTGDILFFEGRTARSLAVRALDPAPGRLSHLGIVVRDSGCVRIVHASPHVRGKSRAVVRSEPLDSFYHHAGPVRTRVYRCTNDSCAQCAARWVERQARMRIPFDGHFDMHSDTALYCTELVWKAFLQAGVDLTGGVYDIVDHPFGRLEVVFPSRLARSPTLTEVSSSHRQCAR
jgi:hypothetical protein